MCSLLSNTFQEIETIKCWKTSSAGCEIHPRHVVHGSKQSYFTINTSVRLHTFKQLLSIVENLHNTMLIVNTTQHYSDLGSWVNAEVFEWNNFWWVPATWFRPVNGQHMIGEHLAKCQLIDWRFGLHLGQSCLAYLKFEIIQFRWCGGIFPKNQQILETFCEYWSCCVATSQTTSSHSYITSSLVSGQH